MFVIALWPSQYPYGQAPQVKAEQQAKDGIGSSDTAEHSPAPQENKAGQPQRQNGSEHASETTILSIKPGEWLIGIITWMLWYATFKLVRGADRTAERQLRAYISVETGANLRQSRRRKTIFEFRPVVRNNGTTPANNVRIVSRVGLVPPDIPANFDYTLVPSGSVPMTSITGIGPRQERFHGRVANGYCNIADLRAIATGQKIFHIYGTVFYDDIFGAAHRTNFGFLIFVGASKRSDTVWHSTERNNDAT